jgi:hypothetical protein
MKHLSQSIDIYQGQAPIFDGKFDGKNVLTIGAKSFTVRTISRVTVKIINKTELYQ